MARCIDADKLIEHINDNVNLFPTWAHVVLAKETLIKAINKQESAWISAKDRLPEDGVRVLTCDCNGNMRVSVHLHDDDEPFGTYGCCKVEYWMPLPAAPDKEVTTWQTR